MDSARDRYLNSVNLNIGTEFPYLVLDVVNDHSSPRNPGFQVMHWHEDLQFIYVLHGAIQIQTLDETVPIRAGEAVFINQNVVHGVSRLGDCHYNSFLFPPYFLEFYPGSPARAFVEPVTANEQLALIPIAPSVDWQRELLAGLRQLAELETSKTPFYPYEVLVRLSSIWLILRRNLAIPPKRKESVVSLRMQKVLRYVEEHYGENLSLEVLAKSADISPSECLRCFRLSLGTTPYQYLTEFRLSKAAQLLTSTSDPVGDIAASVGFHQPSHFGKRFKEHTGYSPREYRKRFEHSGQIAI